MSISMNSDQLSSFMKASMAIGSITCSLNTISHRMGKMTAKVKCLQDMINVAITEVISTKENTTADVVTLINRTKTLEKFYTTITSDITQIVPQQPPAIKQDDVIVIDEDDEEHPSPPDDPILITNKQFINVQRECPICFVAHTTDKMVAAQCSHWMCCECFHKMPNTRCPLCNADIQSCIQYDLYGDNLKYKTVHLQPIQYPHDSEDEDSTEEIDDDDDDNDEDYVVPLANVYDYSHGHNFWGQRQHAQFVNDNNSISSDSDLMTDGDDDEDFIVQSVRRSRNTSMISSVSTRSHIIIHR